MKLDDEAKHQQVKDLEDKLNQICPNLYHGKYCNAYCPKYGWMDIISEMSLKLEMLNVQLKSYGVRVVIQQCKDKYGTLRVYIDATAIMPWHVEFAVNALDAMHSWIDRHFKYDMKAVVDMPSYSRVEEDEVDKAEHDYNAKCATLNVRYVERDGKFFRQGSYQVMRKSHYEATKNVFVKKLSDWMADAQKKISMWFSSKKNSNKQQFALHYGSIRSNEIVEEAERKSEHVCEECGAQLGTRGASTHCQTIGWVRNLCRECAQKSGAKFFMNGEVHECQNRIISQEETKMKYGDVIS